ncbi:esterase [Streptomyces hygroscopicus subsp. jinggangensis 5008]|uniref:Esterase n=1 Tax=Streptomyces hygroscopicus subsp. jinggangensis TaxID=311982 RepID=Q1L2J3_STRHY|nr:esterase [Streptomyces hygroscopicus subsp. jinggangensis]AEY85571.1 esterase [Streptomyces hygroscopicus subsp. jinggangensis 5008]AGF59793.1 esterase [Streptomyces hygroscopicus subsp. jinggangensis TL01]
MPFDPEAAIVLEGLGDLCGVEPSSPAGVPRWRAHLAETSPDPTLEELRDGGRFEVVERTVPGPGGAPDVPLLIARPAGLPDAAPVVYHLHGGGMISGSSRTGMPGILREWAAPLGLVVVSADYRLAPEHPYPAGVEDCYAGLVWVARHAAEIGGDPERIVVAGGSAGGGLTAAVALLARDRGGPRLVGQLAMCPMLDDRNDTPSARQMAGHGVWDRRANEAGWTSLLGEARATDLSGLPPAYIDAGAAETYRDEDITYASRIWQAGGDAELHVWSGGFHGADQIAPDTAVARDAREARVRWLCRILDR